MKGVVKSIIEIAGGLVLGSLVSEGLDKVIEVSKKVVENKVKKES